MSRLVPILLAIVAGQAEAADTGGPPMTRAEAEALAKKPECAAAYTADVACWKILFADEAAAYLSGSEETLAEEVMKAWSANPPEAGALRGVRLPSDRSKAKECMERIVSAGNKECVGAGLVADMSRWLRKEPSQFGAGVVEALTRYRQYRSDVGFQKSRWGMTAAEVVKLYPALKPQRGGITGKMTVAELPARVHFRFVDDRLWAVEVGFAVDSVQPERDVQKTADLRKLLTSKYGDAETHDGASTGEEHPVDELYRAVGGTGRAVRSGRMLMHASWTQGDMTIDLTLGAPDGEYEHRLAYRSSVLVGRANASRDERRASDL